MRERKQETAGVSSTDTASQNGNEGRPLRVGILSLHDPSDPDVLSGMPYGTWRALTGAGLDLVDLGRLDTSRRLFNPFARFRDVPILRRAREPWHEVREWFREAPYRFGGYRKMVQIALRASAYSQSSVDRTDVDVVFGLCISLMMYRLETDLPVVYTSDTTARLINESYPLFRKRSRGYHKACDEIERVALQNSDLFLAASHSTARSAKDDYGLSPERVLVIEYGAHVVPGPDEVIEADPPDRGNLQLMIVAADPVRKRLDLCIDVAEILSSRNWAVTLHYIGVPHARASRSDLVVYHGPLRLSDPNDRERHKKILRRSHWLLLPSTGEAFGIAPCEAAHFGRPSIVSDAGGLPTVVQHGTTGVVVPVEESAESYANAIERYSIDVKRYAMMSKAALHRARTVLSWDAWAVRVRESIEGIVRGTSR